MGLAMERERARRLATQVVSVAIGIMGITLVIFSVALVVGGGAAFLFLSLLLFLVGALLSAIGFFFQLVPFRLEELARQKREYDARQRDAGHLPPREDPRYRP